MSTNRTELLQTKRHFETLDGLRGVAAIAVVVFHFMEFVIPDYEQSFIAHGYLAVDFFFCLSGFVIAYAYDSRIEKIGMLQFIKLRLIRLHPLVVIGAIIGLLAFVFDPFSNLYEKFSGKNILLMFLSAAFLIPYPIVPERYNNLFHLNAPSWSLLWEYVINIFYALLLYRVTKIFLYILLTIAAILLCYESYRSGFLGVGWGADNAWAGGIRVLYSFVAGMIVYRSNWVIKSRLGFLAVSVLLLIVFLVPFTYKTSAFVDPLIVIFYFPLLIAVGAGITPTGTVKRICKFSGDISYSLYMFHYPFLWIFLSYIEKHKPSLQEMTFITVIGTILLIGFAYLLMIFVDLPVRKWLAREKIRERIK